MIKSKLGSAAVLISMLFWVGALSGCGGGGSSGSSEDTGDPADPTFAEASFTQPTEIDNLYQPMVPETVSLYQNVTEDGIETIVVEVLDETRDVNGVACRVVRDRVFLE